MAPKIIMKAAPLVTALKTNNHLAPSSRRVDWECRMEVTQNADGSGRRGAAEGRSHHMKTEVNPRELSAPAAH